MRCEKCGEVTMKKSWEYQGKVFAKHECPACQFKSKAFLDKGLPSNLPKSEAVDVTRPRVDSNGKKDYRSFLMAYAKDITVAKINKGDDVDPAVYTINIYKLLLKAYEGIETPEGSFDV